MQPHPFGARQIPVPRIGQGTWQMADDDRRAAIAALIKGIELGMTHIDTAELYGEAESMVAEAIEDRREQVFLVSKVLPSNASRRGTVQACERSLRKLRTDRLDCYLLHWRGGHPLADTIAAFDELERAGKIRSWGVSNFDVPDLEEARDLAGPGRIACNQVLYHLRERSIEHAVLPWCETNQVALVGYSPFGHGRFPGDNTPGGQVLAAIARDHGATTRQVALRFLTRRPSLFAIPKASSAEHAEDNAGAGDLELSDAELARIGDAFPAGPQQAELPML